MPSFPFLVFPSLCPRATAQLARPVSGCAHATALCPYLVSLCRLPNLDILAQCSVPTSVAKGNGRLFVPVVNVFDFERVWCHRGFPVTYLNAGKDTWLSLVLSSQHLQISKSEPASPLPQYSPELQHVSFGTGTFPFLLCQAGEDARPVDRWMHRVS